MIKKNPIESFTKYHLGLNVPTFCVLYAKMYTGPKKSTPPTVVAVVTNMSYVKKFIFTRIKHHSSYCVDVLNLSCSFGIKDFCQLDHCWQSSNYFVFFQKSCKISDLLSELLLLASSINFTSVTELILLQNNVRTTLHWEREREKIRHRNIFYFHDCFPILNCFCVFFLVTFFMSP